jgi:DNA polymerase III delta subunit
MLTELNDQITSFSSQTRRKITSILSESLMEKNELSNLISKVSSFTSPASYSPRVIRPLEVTQKESIIDIFRDIDLRVKSQYDVSNSLSLLSSSISNVFGGELSKIEKDLNYLEAYIDKYSFISGEDDLYNSSFIENFDNNINSYENDQVVISLTDRDRSKFCPI